MWPNVTQKKNVTQRTPKQICEPIWRSDNLNSELHESLPSFVDVVIIRCEVSVISFRIWFRNINGIQS